MSDTNVEAVREKLRQRSEAGLKKYGVTTERTDLTRKQWLTHAQEEALDFAVYLQRLINDEDKLVSPTTQEESEAVKRFRNLHPEHDGFQIQEIRNLNGQSVFAIGLISENPLPILPISR